jgi:hypothetical protein
MLGYDKNGPQCVRCDKRVAYVEALGGMFHGMPIEESDMVRKRWTDEEDIEIMRTIDHPAAEVAQKLGRALGSIYTRRSELKGFGRSEETTRKIKQPAAGVVTVSVSNNMTIDLGDYGDVYRSLCKRAESELRTVNAQAVWILKCALQGGPSDH